MIPGSRSFRPYPSSLILAGALALASAPGHAIDEGVAKGDLVVDGRTIRLAHSYAHRHDNGERLLDGPELRILLSDRKVSHTLLAGIRPARLTELARKGGVEGMLLTVDAHKPLAGIRGALLTAGKDPRTSLASFSSSGAGIRKLAIGNNRVLGDVHHQSLSGSPAFEYSATFSAPLFREEPITEKLAGTRAVQSAPFKAFALYHESLRAGEVETARRLATPEAFREVDALIAQAGRSEAIRTIRNMTPVPGIRDQPQVFVRGRRALIVFERNGGVSKRGRGPGVQALARTGGQWLVDAETGVIREQTGKSWQK